MFHVGQLVICVEDCHSSVWPDLVTPKRGTVYTIRRCKNGRRTRTGEPAVGVHLMEVMNGPRNCGPEGMVEPAWDALHFRPIDDTKIDVFRKALRSTPVDDRETV